MALFLRVQHKQIRNVNVLCGGGQRSVELRDQRYGYQMLMYSLCTAPTELWARPALLDISYPLAWWSQKKSVLFALEKRAFTVNKSEKWQTRYNEELPENTHSVAELTWRTNCPEKVGQENMKGWRNKKYGGGTTGLFVRLSILYSIQHFGSLELWQC